QVASCYSDLAWSSRELREVHKVLPHLGEVSAQLVATAVIFVRFGDLESWYSISVGAAGGHGGLSLELGESLHQLGQGDLLVVDDGLLLAHVFLILSPQCLELGVIVGIGIQLHARLGLGWLRGLA